MTTITPQKKTYDVLKGTFGYTNIMQTPKITKVIVSTGVGSTKDKKRREFIMKRIASITGQKPSERVTRQSIASFKMRAGETAGYQVTLRGERAQTFLDKLIHITFPRVKDFRGLQAKAIDGMGNITLGFKDHTVFPEASDDDSREVFGLAVTIVTTAKTKKESEALLRHVGIPLQVTA
jgi:large subunit ribosomal protein L5